jgi:hypothetical protein
MAFLAAASIVFLATVVVCALQLGTCTGPTRQIMGHNLLGEPIYAPPHSSLYEPRPPIWAAPEQYSPRDAELAAPIICGIVSWGTYWLFQFSVLGNCLAALWSIADIRHLFFAGRIARFFIGGWSGFTIIIRVPGQASCFSRLACSCRSPVRLAGFGLAGSRFSASLVSVIQCHPWRRRKNGDPDAHSADIA